MSTSIITNNAALLAVEVLNATSSQLQSTQKQISTGYRVADATDDGAAFAVAQSVRSSIGTLTTANQQLGSSTGLLNTTLAAVTDISNTLNSAKDVLLELASTQNQTGATFSQYKAQYQGLIQNVLNDAKDAVYGGKTLIGDFGNYTASGTTPISRLSVVRNEVGSTYGVTYTGFSAIANSLLAITTALTSSSTAAAVRITLTGEFTKFQNTVGTALNTYGSAVNFVSNQISYNNDKIDALTTGLGALVDANLTNESAQLQALQVRQSLATQSLSIANSAPQSLLKLFQ